MADPGRAGCGIRAPADALSSHTNGQVTTHADLTNWAPLGGLGSHIATGAHAISSGHGLLAPLCQGVEWLPLNHSPAAGWCLCIEGPTRDR